MSNSDNDSSYREHIARITDNWNSKRALNNNKLSQLTPFIDFYMVLENSTDESLARTDDFPVEILNLETDSQELLLDNYTPKLLNIAKMESQLARYGDRLYSESGGIGIIDLNVKRSTAEAFTIKFEMNMIISNSDILNTKAWLSKLLTLNSTYLIIHGWSGFELDNNTINPPTPFIDIQNNNTKTLRLDNSSKSNGYWDWNFVKLYKFNFNVDNVGRLNVNLQFVNVATSELQFKKRRDISGYLLRDLKYPTLLPDGTQKRNFLTNPDDFDNNSIIVDTSIIGPIAGLEEFFYTWPKDKINYYNGIKNTEDLGYNINTDQNGVIISLINAGQSRQEAPSNYIVNNQDLGYNEGWDPIWTVDWNLAQENPNSTVPEEERKKYLGKIKREIVVNSEGQRSEQITHLPVIENIFDSNIGGGSGGTNVAFQRDDDGNIVINFDFSKNAEENISLINETLSNLNIDTRPTGDSRNRRELSDGEKELIEEGISLNNSNPIRFAENIATDRYYYSIRRILNENINLKIAPAFVVDSNNAPIIKDNYFLYNLVIDLTDTIVLEEESLVKYYNQNANLSYGGRELQNAQSSQQENAFKINYIQFSNSINPNQIKLGNLPPNKELQWWPAQNISVIRDTEGTERRRLAAITPVAITIEQYQKVVEFLRGKVQYGSDVIRRNMLGDINNNDFIRVNRLSIFESAILNDDLNIDRVENIKNKLIKRGSIIFKTDNLTISNEQEDPESLTTDIRDAFYNEVVTTITTTNNPIKIGSTPEGEPLKQGDLKKSDWLLNANEYLDFLRDYEYKASQFWEANNLKINYQVKFKNSVQQREEDFVRTLFCAIKEKDDEVSSSYSLFEKYTNEDILNSEFDLTQNGSFVFVSDDFSNFIQSLRRSYNENLQSSFRVFHGLVRVNRSYRDYNDILRNFLLYGEDKEYYDGRYSDSQRAELARQAKKHIDDFVPNFWDISKGVTQNVFDVIFSELHDEPIQTTTRQVVSYEPKTINGEEVLVAYENNTDPLVVGENTTTNIIKIAYDGNYPPLAGERRYSDVLEGKSIFLGGKETPESFPDPNSTNAEEPEQLDIIVIGIDNVIDSEGNFKVTLNHPLAVNKGDIIYFRRLISREVVSTGAEVEVTETENQPIAYYLGAVMESILSYINNSSNQANKIFFSYAKLPSIIKTELARLNIKVKSFDYNNSENEVVVDIANDSETTFDLPLDYKSVDNLLTNRNLSNGSLITLMGDLLKTVNMGIMSAAPPMILSYRQRPDLNNCYEIYVSSKDSGGFMRELSESYSAIDFILDGQQRTNTQTIMLNFGDSGSLVESFNISSKIDPLTYAAFKLPVNYGFNNLDLRTIFNTHQGVTWLTSTIDQAKAGANSLFDNIINRFGLEEDIRAKIEDIKTAILASNTSAPSFSTEMNEAFTSLLMSDPEYFTKFIELAISAQNTNKETNTIVSDLLLNFLFNVDATIHGTTGIYLFDPIIVNNFISKSNGIYLVNSIQEQISIGNFSTILNIKLHAPFLPTEDFYTSSDINPTPNQPPGPQPAPVQYKKTELSQSDIANGNWEVYQFPRPDGSIMVIHRNLGYPNNNFYQIYADRVAVVGDEELLSQIWDFIL